MNNNTKRIGGLVIILLGMLISLSAASACQIQIKVLDASKKTYKVGDELVVKVSVQLTHRNCSEGIESTKFNPKDLKILSAGKWTESGNGLYERKVKIKITGKSNDQAVLHVVRTCRRDGGSGKLTLKVN